MRRLEMKKNDRGGLLITFCGLDGSGKTTLINRLVNDLKAEGNGEVFVTKQPTPYVRGSEIFRTYMDNPCHDDYDYRSLSLLAASDRIQHTTKVIGPMLERGRTVISDRYFYSCLANLVARGYGSDKWIYEISRSVIKPDIAFFCEVPVEEALMRVRSRPEERDRYIDVPLQYNLQKAFKKICKKNGGVPIDTTKSEDECYEEVKKALRKVMSEGENRRKG